MFVVQEDECISCMACESECPTGAIEMRNDIAFIVQDKCESCGDCVEVCPTGAIIEK
jgi:ferredoxin